MFFAWSPIRSSAGSTRTCGVLRPAMWAAALDQRQSAAWATSLPAAEPAAPPKVVRSVADASTPALRSTNAVPRFEVKAYVVKCDPLVFTNTLASVLSPYTGTNVSLDRIVQAASDLLSEYQKKGYPKANISIAQELITNGIVTMHVYKGVFPQVLISGQPWFTARDAGPASILVAAAPPAAARSSVAAARAEAASPARRRVVDAGD